ncbi:uncharacterized protein [Penaeus vannamei]|uniref:uncharacterized protein n=1 Tax=Penaeus vannamei TaxID=6689 RepID=UPI00387F5400
MAEMVTPFGHQTSLTELWKRVINKSWQKQLRCPRAGNKPQIVPIPKPKEPGKYRPISLLSCLRYQLKKMVLNRLQWKTGPPHEHLNGFTRDPNCTEESKADSWFSWKADYFKNRSANVRFQGHLSQHMPLENGTPQGGVLSPALFINFHVQHTRHSPAREGCKIISYADDLAIIASGNHSLTRAQRCLNLVSVECCRT